MRIVKPAEERKNEILDVAEQLFAEKGFDNASTNDIINRIGIARGTLYHHFGSKEEILDALVERMAREGIARARAIISDKNLPLLERLSGAVMALNLDNGAGQEVFEQIHKPQNALLHQKMQESLIRGVVPLISELIQASLEFGNIQVDSKDITVVARVMHDGNAVSSADCVLFNNGYNWSESLSQAFGFIKGSSTRGPGPLFYP